jgi:glycine cleavage system H protein
MASPTELRYTKSHEWVRLDGDIATMGITDYAQNELGDITYLELPEIGDAVTKEEPLGVVESVKAATDLYAPVDGEVIERNGEVIDSPEVVNSSPYDQAWLLRIRVSDPAQIAALMDSTRYDEFSENAAAH